jgi:hypothetical protein
VPLSSNTVSRRMQHIAEDVNDQLIEKWGWIQRFKKMCGDELAHPSY